MKEYNTADIRNVCILGHQGSGKTTLSESLLFVSKGIEKKGEIERKNTVSDFLVEEQSKLSSLSTSIIPVLWKNTKINFLDVPGNDEFLGDLYQSLSVVKGCIVVIDGQKGVEVGTERVLQATRARHLPTIIFINKMDKENIKYQDLLEKIKTSLGKSVVPFTYPLGHDDNFDGTVDVVNLVAKSYKNKIEGEVVELFEDKKTQALNLRGSLIELAAETSEELMDLYFSGEELSIKQIVNGLKIGLYNGDITPILVGSSTKNIGVDTLLDMVNDFFPSPAELNPQVGLDQNQKSITRLTSDNEPTSLYVFKTTVDPFLGTISYLKVNSGTLTLGAELVLSSNLQTKKIMNLFYLKGKTQIEAGVIHAGDICAVAKLDGVLTGDTLCDKNNIISYSPGFKLSSVIYVAIQPKNKNDEDKISQALQKLNLEDPTFEVVRNKETSQQLLGGQGMNHITYIIERMKNMFKVEIETSPQKIVYRETIKKSVIAEGKHKKQSGGSGQYGHVWIRFEPYAEGNFLFDEEVFGGSVPKNYHPAVEKGLVQTFEHGPLAGFPVINVKAVLFDGSYHPVDSNEISFVLAAALAFKEACDPKNPGKAGDKSGSCNPTILEPICRVDVTVKNEFVGDVMGDMNKRRGRVLGMDQKEGFQVISAECPEAEIVSYSIDLKAMTQGSGSFIREFIRYDEVPGLLIPKIIEQYKKAN